MSKTTSEAEAAIAIKVAAAHCFEEFVKEMEKRRIRLSARDLELVRNGYVSGFAAGVLMATPDAND